jgi:hypothetical protein
MMQLVYYIQETMEPNLDQVKLMSDQVITEFTLNQPIQESTKLSEPMDLILMWCLEKIDVAAKRVCSLGSECHQSKTCQMCADLTVILVRLAAMATTIEPDDSMTDPEAQRISRVIGLIYDAPDPKPWSLYTKALMIACLAVLGQLLPRMTNQPEHETCYSILAYVVTLLVSRAAEITIHCKIEVLYKFFDWKQSAAGLQAPVECGLYVTMSIQVIRQLQQWLPDSLVYNMALLTTLKYLEHHSRVISIYHLVGVFELSKSVPGVFVGYGPEALLQQLIQLIDLVYLSSSQRWRKDYQFFKIYLLLQTICQVLVSLTISSSPSPAHVTRVIELAIECEMDRAYYAPVDLAYSLVDSVCDLVVFSGPSGISALYVGLQSCPQQCYRNGYKRSHALMSEVRKNILTKCQCYVLAVTQSWFAGLELPPSDSGSKYFRDSTDLTITVQQQVVYQGHRWIVAPRCKWMDSMIQYSNDLHLDDFAIDAVDFVLRWLYHEFHFVVCDIECPPTTPPCSDADIHVPLTESKPMERLLWTRPELRNAVYSITVPQALEMFRVADYMQIDALKTQLVVVLSVADASTLKDHAKLLVKFAYHIHDNTLVANRLMRKCLMTMTSQDQEWVEDMEYCLHMRSTC